MCDEADAVNDDVVDIDELAECIGHCLRANNPILSSFTPTRQWETFTLNPSSRTLLVVIAAGFIADHLRLTKKEIVKHLKLDADNAVEVHMSPPGSSNAHNDGDPKPLEKLKAWLLAKCDRVSVIVHEQRNSRGCTFV